MFNFDNGWNKLFEELKTKQYFLDLLDFLNQEYESKTIYPEKKNLFNCFKKCSFDNLKV